MLLAIPTYTKFDLCVEAIKTAQNGKLPPKDIMIWDNSGGRFKIYLEDNNIDIHGITVVRSPINLGCARAWNAMLRIMHENHPDEWVCVANDDISFEPDTLALFEQAAHERDKPVYVAGGVASPNAFSLFVTRYDKLLDTAGLFDEWFRYPYCEDGDMGRRLWLAGYELERVEGCSAGHVGSATLASFDDTLRSQHHIRFERNAVYFEMKWNIGHNEIYSERGWRTPFNNDQDYEKMVKDFIVKQYGE